MTTDNTQELDVLKYVLLKAYYQGKDGEGYSDAQIKQDKQSILDWHNKQVGKLLSNPQPTYARSLKNLGKFLERYDLDIGLAEDKESLKKWSDAIQAERNKLKESSDD